MGIDFWNECAFVEMIPGKLDGRPVIRGTRVEADLVPESIELGLTPQQVAATYRVKLNDVLGVDAYYRSHVDNAAAVR